MASKERIEEVGKYIDKYYEPETDDFKIDEEMISIFDKITNFRKKRKKQKKQEAPAYYEADMSAPPEFDVGSMKKTKIIREMSQAMVTNRNIDDLMSQMEEIFFQNTERYQLCTKQENGLGFYDSIGIIAGRSKGFIAKRRVCFIQKF